ncbi:MAG: zinc-binding dehydrogenase [Bifidobacterium crudilactis]|nr:zinc-binding dehydrogenase [Bifidobacterium crudilactis]
MHAVDLLKLHPYQKALVIGDGFMGQLFVQVLQAYGVHEVDLAGIVDEKLKLNAERFHVVNTYNTLRESIPEGRYDVIVEAVGLPSTQAQAIAAANKGAQVLMFGVGPQEAVFEMNTYDIYKKQLTIQGSFINPLTFSDAIALLSSRKVDVDSLISHEFALEQVQDFLDGAITGVSKAVVRLAE